MVCEGMARVMAHTVVVDVRVASSGSVMVPRAAHAAGRGDSQSTRGIRSGSGNVPCTTAPAKTRDRELQIIMRTPGTRLSSAFAPHAVRPVVRAEGARLAAVVVAVHGGIVFGAPIRTLCTGITGVDEQKRDQKPPCAPVYIGHARDVCKMHASAGVGASPMVEWGWGGTNLLFREGAARVVMGTHAPSRVLSRSPWLHAAGASLTNAES